MSEGRTKVELVRTLLSDIGRRMVLILLSEPRNIGSLAESLGVDRSTVCFHLSMLETTGLLKSEYRIVEGTSPRGRAMAARSYSIDEDRLREAVETMEELVRPIKEALKEGGDKDA